MEKNLLLTCLFLILISALSCGKEEKSPDGEIGGLNDNSTQQVTAPQAVPSQIPVLNMAQLNEATEETSKSIKDTEKSIRELEGRMKDLDPVLEKTVRTVEDLEDRMSLLSIAMDKLTSAIPEDEEITVASALPELYKSASKVEIFSMEDVWNCDDYSTYEFKEGDSGRVEVIFVRNEDGFTEEQIISPYLSYYQNREYAVGDLREVGIEEFDRIIDNPWNNSSNSYISALYKGTFLIDKVGFYGKTELLNGDAPPLPGTFVLYLTNESRWRSGILPLASEHPAVPVSEASKYNQSRTRYEDNRLDLIADSKDFKDNLTSNQSCSGRKMPNLVPGTLIVAWFLSEP